MGSIKPNPRNRNIHPKEQIDRLGKLLLYQGWRHPVIISNLSGFIVAGHGRVEAAKKVGATTVPVDYQDFPDEESEYAFLQSDNAIASWADLDLSGINTDLADLGPDFDIDWLGLKDFEIEPADKYQDKDADAVPDNAPPKTKLGQIWKLGEHRLMCGDATKDIDALLDGVKIDMVYTDPPYGLDIDTDRKSFRDRKKKGDRITHQHTKMHGDNEKYDPTFLLDYFGDVPELFLWGANYYLGSNKGSWVCWIRATTEGMKSQLGTHFELCWSYRNHQNLIAEIAWKGAAGHIKKYDGERKTHPTQKPVRLVEWFFNKWGTETQTVVDPYGGSGSTLIACEKTNRQCYMMEIEPKYCDVIIKRWEDFTENKAELIHDV